MSDKIKTFAQFGDAGHGGITRYSLSPESAMARAEFVKRKELQLLTCTKAKKADITTVMAGTSMLTLLGLLPLSFHC